MLIYKIVNYKYGGDTVSRAVGTTEYSIANEQVVMRVVLSFSLFLYWWEEISKNLPLVISILQISQELLLGSNPLPFSMIFETLLQIPAIPFLSPFFSF